MTTFAEGRERNLALGIYGAASGSGAAAGVLLGGVLTSYLSWPWIFFINVPVGLAAIALAPVLLRESRAELDHRHFDVAGAATITAGLMLLVYALTRATTDGWGSAVDARPARRARSRSSLAFVVDRAALEGAAAPAADLPAAHARRRERAMAIVGAVAFSEFFVLTLYLQDVLHYSAHPERRRVRRASRSPSSSRRTSPRSSSAASASGATLTAGLLLSAVSVALLTRLPVDGHYFWDLFPAFVLGGAGMGALVRPGHDREPHGRRARPTRASPPGSSTRAARSAARSASPPSSAIAAASTEQLRRRAPGSPRRAPRRSTTASRPRSRSDRAPARRRSRCGLLHPTGGRPDEAVSVPDELRSRGGRLTWSQRSNECRRVRAAGTNAVVAALLDDIASRRERLYLLQARGARPAGLRALKAELQAVKDELAAVVHMRSASG